MCNLNGSRAICSPQHWTPGPPKKHVGLAGVKQQGKDQSTSQCRRKEMAKIVLENSSGGHGSLKRTWNRTRKSAPASLDM